MTYREAIQKLVSDIDTIYEKAGDLRDAAVDEEKDYWNDVRTLTSQAEQVLNKLDNRLKDDRAQLKLKGTY